MVSTFQNYLLSKVKASETLLNFVAAIYSSKTSIFLKGSKHNKIQYTGAFLKKTDIKINGSNNIVDIAPKVRLINCLLNIRGNHCRIRIDPSCTLKNVELWIEDTGSQIIIESRTTIEGGHLASTEGKTITIGNDCMFSNHIEIRNGDSHSIFSTESSQRINPAKEVKIGNHVWLGSDVKVLKGTVIDDGTIIGTGSIVSGLIDSNCIYAGIPAKKVKEHVSWRRDRK